MNELLTNNIKNSPNQRILNLLRNPKINVFTSEYIVSLITRQSLMKIQDFMKKIKVFNITGFLRFFRELLPFKKSQSTQQQQFFVYYALFKLFTQICNSKKKSQITFSDISSYIAEKMPNFTQQSIIQQKLLPLGLNIDQQHKAHIYPPEVYGQIYQDHYFLTPRPIRSDRIQHLGRQVGQSQYSKKHKIYFSIDKPSTIISIYDDNFNLLNTLKTQQEMTKRDMIVTNIAWSDRQQKIACILGNYSISMWSKQDNYKYEVNIPLPSQYLANPFVVITYMDSMRKWITLDNRPAIYVLNNNNYQPQYVFMNSKINKKKQTQKYHLVELKYLHLLCIGFERNLFLVSLKNKQIVSQVNNFRTAITSIAFSQSYQALFVSTYENYFRSFQLSQFQDLMERGTFQGHKSQISLLGVIEQKPIVFSIQQNSILKMFDVRNYTCYQSISVLKNIIYRQVLYLEEAICLVGSKMHVYGIQKQLAYQQKQVVIYLGTLHKDLLVVTNKNVRIYDIRNGALTSVIKAIFQSQQNSNDIFSTYIMPTKQKMILNSQQGQCVILQTKQMSQIQKWKLQPKPTYMYFDEQNDLLTQVSQGNIYVNQYQNQFCQKQLRRQITNSIDIIRLIKISVKHDLMIISYEGDQNLYFYAYEKGKMLGYLFFGDKKIVKFKNAYKEPKIIHKVTDFQFYQNKNVILVLLDNQLVVVTYKRSLASLIFMIKKRIKLFQNPIKLADHTQYIYDVADLEIPLYSTGLTLFDNEMAITTNKTTILCTITHNINNIAGVQVERISKQNYNPSRIGIQQHTGPAQAKNPLVSITDQTQQTFQVKYYVFKQNLGDFVVKSKIGNLLVVADNKLNVILWQSPVWKEIAGMISCEDTLPKIWNIFKYSEQQINEVQFILSFIQNQYKLPTSLVVKSLVQNNIKAKQTSGLELAKITISQLIKQDRLKDGGLKTYRSCSLREKKIVLEKDRQQKQKLQNFIEQQKLEKKQKPNFSLKNQAQKQINDILGYLSINHNQTIMKKGIAQEDFLAVRLLQKKLDAAVNKQQKKSLVSLRTGQQSQLNKKIQMVTNFSLKQIRMAKTLSTEVYQGLTSKLGLKSYNSRQLIGTLNKQKNKSKNKLRSTSNSEKLPQINKN